MSTDAAAVLTIAGPLTMRTAQAWRARGRKAIAAGACRVDLSAVTEADSAALALLLDWQRAALEARAGALTLVGLPAGLASLAELYGIESLLPTAAA